MGGDVSELRSLIYEAVFDPDLWLEVLRGMEELTGAASSSLIVYEASVTPRYVATAHAKPLMDRFIGEGLWQAGRRIEYFHQHPSSGFVRTNRYFPSEFLAVDAQHILWAESGLSIQVEAIIEMRSGDILAFTFERRDDQGDFSEADLDRFAIVYPDIARAVGMAAQFASEEDRRCLATLARLGIPAAILTTSGRLWAANTDFGALEKNLFTPSATDRPIIVDHVADALFESALLDALLDSAALQVEGTVRSVAVPAAEGRPPTVIYLVPLACSGSGLFFFGRILVVVSPLSRSDPIMSPKILSGLFSLTPSEAKLAGWLATGGSIKAGAARFGITEKSARTYLERIFRKTRTASQIELALLLNSGPISRLGTGL